MKENRTLLKAALLSSCLIWASINAITANIPEMAKSFPDQELYVIELIATIPSLFQMVAVLLCALCTRLIGNRRTAMLGLLLCGVSGVAPIIIQDFYLLFASRCIFGVGCGLIVPSVLTLIISLFDGAERSSMIGLQGSVGGLGSAATALVAGWLLAFGWRWSFAVYALAFAVLAFFATFVPNTGESDAGKASSPNTKNGRELGVLALQCALMFVSILVITLFVVKASTFITEAGLGDAQQGSLAITLVSLGSLLAGALYGKIRGALGDYALVAFLAIGVAGFALAAVASSLVAVLASAFLIGYAMMAIVPHLQENVSTQCAGLGQLGTNLILVAQALGAFAAPYLGTFLGLFTPQIPGQFWVCAGCLGALAAAALVMAKAASRKRA